VSAGDLDELDRRLTDDVVWHVGGNHPLSGDYRGRQAVREYHRKVADLTAGSLRLEPVDILASESHLGIFLRASAAGEGRRLDTTMVEAVRLSEDGRWAEFWALADDQTQVDDFWKAVAR
jgi:ketosteroid isomerase-like protein